MSQSKRFPDRGEIYGVIAFAGTGLAAMSPYVTASRIDGEAWQVALCLIFSGLYILAGCFSSYFVDNRPLRASAIYTIIQGALGITVVYLSPIRGMVGIILLPLASQAVFMYPKKVAFGIGVILWVMTAGVFLAPYGWAEFRYALLSYSPAYIFTILFSFVTRQALLAREHAIELKNELEIANAQLRSQAAQTEELATTRERNRLAREIHDGVGHYLTVINVQTEAAQSLLKSDPERASDALNKAAQLSRDALADVRRSVGSLRTEEKRPPLIDTLRNLTVGAAVPIDFKVIGESRQLSTASEHALFRAAQEALTNIAKHAQATQSWLELDFSDVARAKLVVKDNGCGTRSGIADSRGFGICGMRERVDLLGGTVSSGDRAEGGFQVYVEVPA
ncbi:MAG: sensor histidine kinase [Opitutaceae bacterium]|jgi:signal transduction histidine kinase|nr:sensor histidine kinase [Opitutaceae bacterium]